MKIAVEGCCHGELDKIYETLQHLEKENNIKVDLLLICGDFQAVRNKNDMQCMAIPPKYQKLNTFYKYYSGEKTAPVLTLFVGGNHEASNYMQELPYGGWVAPNIYYMGYANVVKIGGLRIAGLSGIYKDRDFHKGHFEHLPYNDSTKRSVYHVRSFEVFRLKQISRPLDIFLSHDWPRGIYNYGNVKLLLRKKAFLRDEIERGVLGSLPAEELLHHLKPSHWFSAHLHVKFAAIIQHKPEDNVTKTTKFLSLDKCLPKRKFLQVIDIPHDINQPMKLQLDPEWLCILKSTNHLLNLGPIQRFMPGPGSSDRWDFKVTDKECESLVKDFDGNLTIPENFERTAPVHDNLSNKRITAPSLYINPQTNLICAMLDLTDPNAVLLGKDPQYSTQDIVDSSDNVEDDDYDDDDDVSSDVNSSIDTSFSDSFSTAPDLSVNDASTSVGDASVLSTDTGLSSLNDTGLNELSIEQENESDVHRTLLRQKAKCLVSKESPAINVDVPNGGEGDSELADILAAQKKHRLSVDKVSSLSSSGDVSSESSSSNYGDVSGDPSSSLHTLDSSLGNCFSNAGSHGDSPVLKSKNSSVCLTDVEKNLDTDSQNSSMEEDKIKHQMLPPFVSPSVRKKVILTPSMCSSPVSQQKSGSPASLEETDILAKSLLSPPVDSSSRAPSEDEGTPKSSGSKRSDSLGDSDVSPHSKKFKRRNQNVYSSSEGDGEF